MRARRYICASATDGHTAIFSFNEIFNSHGGANVIVAYEKNGSSIAESEGAIVLVAGADHRTGCRFVKALDRIDVRVASLPG